MLLLDLADACRKSGLPVVEVAGWKARGHGQMTAVDSVIAHHTATSAAAKGDYPSLGIVRDGRSDLPGPLAQLGLGRDGTVYVIAAGVCYHAGATFETRQDNWHAVGIEAEHDGLSPWPPAQRDAYARLCAALCEHYGLSPDRVQGHKEIAKPLGRKPDPTFDMDLFRDDVADLIEREDMFTDSDRAMLTKLLKKAENSGARERATNALLRKIRKDVAGLPADVVAEIDTALAQD